MHTHIYMYIYIVIHRQLFSVALYTRYLKLELKPSWLYISWISYPKAIVPLSICERMFYVYIYLHILLSAIRVLNLWEELCIYVYVVAGNSPFKCSTYRGTYILSSRDWLFHCITTLLCGYPGNRVVTFPTPCSSNWKGSLQVTLDNGCQLYLLIYFQGYFKKHYCWFKIRVFLLDWLTDQN